MKKNRLQIIIAAAVNCFLTVMYLLAIILMIKRQSIHILSKESPVIISFLPMTLSKALNWGFMFFTSLFVTVYLFLQGFGSKILRIATFVLVVILVLMELAVFLNPFISKISSPFPFHWNFMCTINLIVFLLRVFVAATCFSMIGKIRRK